MQSLENKIKELRNKGLTYDAIASELNCSKGTISYHLGVGQKKKAKERQSKVRRTHNERTVDQLIERVRKFNNDPRNESLTTDTKESTPAQIRSKIKTFTRDGDTPFTLEDVIHKFGENPVCYLTGDAVDYRVPSSFHFDHVTPKCQGGKNTIDNLQLTTPEANRLKGRMTVEETLDLCEKILRYHGRL